MAAEIKPLGLGMASRRVLSDVVTDDLRQAIVEHDLEPGRRISEDELAAQISRSYSRSVSSPRARRSHYSRKTSGRSRCIMV